MRRRFVPLLSLFALMCPAEEVAPDRGPLRLTVKRAVELALSPEGNVRIQISEEAVKQSKARVAEARSALLPNLEGTLGEQSTMRSLATLGVGEVKLPFNVKIPRVVGPFNAIDIRAVATQSILDFSSIRRYQAARAGVRAAKADRGQTDEQVSAAVAKVYLAALRADADAEAVKANVDLAEAVLKQAENQKAAGSGTGIEVTRAKVQLANENQRLLVAQNERNKAHLQLLRAMGLRLDTNVELTDRLHYDPVDGLTVEQAKTEALKRRADLKAQQEKEAASRLMASSVRMERIPTLVSFVDYGTTGTTNSALTSLLPTRDYGIGMRIPIFDGGRRDARRAEAASQFRQERARTNDLREQVDLEIRLALDSLHSAQEQVKVAEAGLALAQSELTQARRRYGAGVASSLEVTDAQTRFERALDNRITALFNHNVARIDLGQATGTIIAELERQEISSGTAIERPLLQPEELDSELLSGELAAARAPAAIANPALPAVSAPAPLATEPSKPATPVAGSKWPAARRSPAIRKAAVRRKAHRRVLHHIAARKVRRATKSPASPSIA